MVEIFSEHGNSFDDGGRWAMLPHSMGGSCRSQMVREQLRRGLHLGFTAGTDNHDGYPASYGEGVTGILAAELSCESVFDALRKRHTIAATGDRICMDVRCGEAIMGDVLPPGAERTLAIGIDPLGPLESVSVLKNGHTIATWPAEPRASAVADGVYLVAVDWGWDRMNSPAVTEWRTRIGVAGGILLGATPRFCGGTSSTGSYVGGDAVKFVRVQ